MGGREEYQETLEACERTSAMLLLALESGAANLAPLIALRQRQVESLSATLPAELTTGDLGRLHALLDVGDQVRARVAAERLSATQSLGSLCRELQVARQLATVRKPREVEIDCLG